MALRAVGAEIAAAGISLRVDGETAANCLKREERPVTPHKIKIHRKTNVGPGQRRVHPGLIDDVKALEKRTYGISSVGSLHVNDVFNHGPQTTMEEALNDNLERTYKSRKKGLGTKTDHGHVLPEKMRSGDFRFGKVDPRGGENAKMLIFPKETEEVSDDIKKMLKKSHGAYAPGEQLTREYDWDSTGLNPATYRFGKTELLGEEESAGQCLNESTGPDDHDTHIISKKTLDHRRHLDRLGKCRDLGLMKPPKGHVFGVKSKILNEWGAAECLRGDYSERDQMPDADLGRATKPGYRNINITGRTFGCPTIRSDIPLPARRSVADNQNYGTDATASGLLRPSRFSTIGVTDEDFLMMRSPQEIREIFANVGQNFSDDNFARIFWRASNGGAHREVSVESFRRAMRESAAGNRVPEWWAAAGEWAKKVTGGDSN